MKLTYDELRPKLQTGDIVAFEKIPITSIRSIADFFGWLSNRMIFRVQRRGNVDNDGYEALVHVAVVLRDGAHDEIMGFEYTAGMKGLVPFRLSARICEYLRRGGNVHIFRLNSRARQRIKNGAVAQWIHDHRNNGYAWEHLPFAEMHWLGLRPRKKANRYYCSAGAMAFLIAVGAIPEFRKVLRKGHWETRPEKPQEISPAELLRRYDLFSRKKQIEVMR